MAIRQGPAGTGGVAAAGTGGLHWSASNDPYDTCHAGPSIDITEVLPDDPTIDRSGGRVWAASEELAAWLQRSFRRGGGCFPVLHSAIELGAGVGLVSITLAKLGVARVVCTDGEPSLPPLCQAHAARNGVTSDQLRALEFRWGDAAQLERVIDEVGDGGQCAELIVASDVLYSVDEASFEALEQALRKLIGRGGCRLVAICWQVRNYNEERFLPRLADLGRVRVAWRSHGLTADDVCPPDGAAESDAWRAQHSMTWAVGVLDMDSLCRPRPPPTVEAS